MYLLPYIGLPYMFLASMLPRPVPAACSHRHSPHPLSQHVDSQLVDVIVYANMIATASYATVFHSSYDIAANYLLCE